MNLHPRWAVSCDHVRGRVPLRCQKQKTQGKLVYTIMGRKGAPLTSVMYGEVQGQGHAGRVLTRGWVMPSRPSSSLGVSAVEDGSQSWEGGWRSAGVRSLWLP